jgi:hypothetical protein
MPPTSPARMITSIGTPIKPGTGAPVDPWIEMILLLTVRATSIERKAPTRFKIADRATATFGFRPRWRLMSPSHWPCHESRL